RRHTRSYGDWSSDVCSSDLIGDMGDDDSDTPALHAAVAVKLFPDGHEEPIRNASVSGLTAASFKSIVAASQSRTVYTSPFHSVRSEERRVGKESRAR